VPGAVPVPPGGLTVPPNPPPHEGNNIAAMISARTPKNLAIKTVLVERRGAMRVPSALKKTTIGTNKARARINRSLFRVLESDLRECTAGLAAPAGATALITRSSMLGFGSGVKEQL
jgi:hypothetical protein